MLLCFDYDGVLVDSLAQQVSVVRSAQSKLGQGRCPDAGDFSSVEDLSYEGFARHLGIPEARYTEWAHLVIEQNLLDTTAVTMFAGMRDVLLELGSRFPSVIITSNVRESVERLLQKERCAHAVQEIYDGKLRGSKSDKIKAAAKHLGIPLAQTYMIGDTRSDIRHAKLAGAKSLAVSWGYQPVEALKLEAPDTLIQVPRDLLVYFGSLDIH